MNTYAAYYDSAIRMLSSSGGLFSLFASKFEVVYGVKMSNNCYEAEFTRIDDGNISELRGSKYFQAKVGDTLKQVKKDLLDGKTVLFSGTGCQINGLKCLLQKEYENLTTVDIICHGTPSPKLWKEYAKYQENKYGKLTNVDFRCKDNNWQSFGMKENQLYIPKDDDVFMRMFLRNHCLRPSCYECHAKQYKTSDITIADFWGIEKVDPEMNDSKGTSLVLVRTKKGKVLFDSLKDTLKWCEVSYEDGIRDNPSEYSSVKRTTLRDTFFDDLDEFTFDEMIIKYASNPRVSNVRKLGSKVKLIIRQIISGGGKARTLSHNDYGVLYIFEKRFI